MSQLCLSQNYFFLTGAPFFFSSPRVLTTTCWNQNVDVSTPAPSSGVISFPSHEGRSTSGSLFGYSQTLRTGGKLPRHPPACVLGGSNRSGLLAGSAPNDQTRRGFLGSHLHVLDLTCRGLRREKLLGEGEMLSGLLKLRGLGCRRQISLS